MKYKWVSLAAKGFKVYWSYTVNGAEYGAVVQSGGSPRAFACNGKFARLIFPKTINEGRIWVQKQYNTRVLQPHGS